MYYDYDDEEEDGCVFDTIPCNHSCPGCGYGPEQEEPSNPMSEPSNPVNNVFSGYVHTEEPSDHTTPPRTYSTLTDEPQLTHILTAEEAHELSRKAVFSSIESATSCAMFEVSTPFISEMLAEELVDLDYDVDSDEHNTVISWYL